jgi:hypothetical protein
MGSEVSGLTLGVSVGIAGYGELSPALWWYRQYIQRLALNKRPPFPAIRDGNPRAAQF